MQILFKIVLGIVLGLFFCVVHKHLKKKKLNNETLITSVMIFIFLVFVAFDVLPIGNTTIGSVFEKEQYSENYYIELYDENDNFMGKYPAVIDVHDVMIHNENDKTHKCRGYDISKIYYDNKEIECNTQVITIEDVKEGNEMRIFDSPMGNIYAKITKEKV